MPNLRTRKSALDPRVTLFSLEPDSVASSSTSISSVELSDTNSASVILCQAHSSPETGPSSFATPGQGRRTSKRSRAKEESDENEDEDETSKTSVKKKKKSPSKPKAPSPTKMRAKLETAHPEPPRWRETYETIRKQRETIVAAVDTMGCDAIAGSNDLNRDIADKDRRLASLISLMLSSQTKDPVTHEAIMNLRRNLDGGLSLQSVLAASDAEIQACINKVGFWRRKTEYIRKTAEILRDKFDGDVPKTIEDLLILPGVGPKMGFICLQSAWGIQSGIGVDTHVHRITNRLGWHRKPTKDPEETRVNLESWLPQELHKDINVMLVGLGQTICLPVNPRCDLCHLGQMENSPCPSKRKVLVKQAKAKKEENEGQSIASSGQVGPVADTELEVEQSDVKPLINVKVETATGPLDRIASAQASPYFNVKKEDPSLAW